MGRGVLLILGLLVLGSVGVGVLIGVQFSGGGDTPVQSQTPTGSPGESTPTPVPGPVQTPDETTQIPPSQSPSGRLRDALLNTINSYRTQHNRNRLTNTGPPTEQLRQMATNHSRHMATVGAVKTSLRGSTGSNRYEAAGLSGSCPFPSNSGYSTIDPSVGKLELVANPIKVPPYENVDAGYDGDVSTVTENALSTWTNSNQDRQKLLYKNAEQVGIGIVITERGSVYITVSLCGV